jgi:hypothetical protein
MNEVNDIVFKSRFSKWIAGMYWIILAVLLIMMIGIPLTIPMNVIVKILFISINDGIAIMFVYLIWKGYTMKFIISKNQIIIYGLIRKINIDIFDVESIKKIPILFGVRLFGAQFLGGIYYFPEIGNASVTMSNFDDTVLITTKQKKNYIITPQNPQDFINTVMKIKNE